MTIIMEFTAFQNATKINKDWLNVLIVIRQISQSINFCFHDAKERMRASAKDQLVIESVVKFKTCTKRAVIFQ